MKKFLKNKNSTIVFLEHIKKFLSFEIKRKRQRHNWRFSLFRRHDNVKLST